MNNIVARIRVVHNDRQTGRRSKNRPGVYPWYLSQMFNCGKFSLEVYFSYRTCTSILK